MGRRRDLHGDVVGVIPWASQRAIVSGRARRPRGRASGGVARAAANNCAYVPVVEDVKDGCELASWVASLTGEGRWPSCEGRRLLRPLSPASRSPVGEARPHGSRSSWVPKGIRIRGNRAASGRGRHWSRLGRQRPCVPPRRPAYCSDALIRAAAGNTRTHRLSKPAIRALRVCGSVAPRCDDVRAQLKGGRSSARRPRPRGR